MLVINVGVFGLLLLITGITADQGKSLYSNFQQNDYKVNFEWGEVVRRNERVLKAFELHVFKYNRTYAALNLTFHYNFEIGNNLELVVQAYKFASNEYRLFPLRFQVNFCEAVAKNLIGAHRALACGNFTGCPILKDKRYLICNFTPDPAQFPPYVPSGKYKIEIEGMYQSDEMFLLNLYGKAYRQFDKK